MAAKKFSLRKISGSSVSPQGLMTFCLSSKAGNPAKPKILITGVPGTGKTTVAKLLSKKTGAALLEINKIVEVLKLYSGVDLAETLSCVTGKWIRRITADYVEFEDGERVDLHNPAWHLIKPLIWW